MEKQHLKHINRERTSAITIQQKSCLPVLESSPSSSIFLRRDLKMKLSALWMMSSRWPFSAFSPASGIVCPKLTQTPVKARKYNSKSSWANVMMGLEILQRRTGWSAMEKKLREMLCIQELNASNSVIPFCWSCPCKQLLVSFYFLDALSVCMKLLKWMWMFAFEQYKNKDWCCFKNPI